MFGTRQNKFLESITCKFVSREKILTFSQWKKFNWLKKKKTKKPSFQTTTVTTVTATAAELKLNYKIA